MPDVSQRAEEKERITFLDLLAMLFLMQPREAVGCLCCRSTLLLHGQLVVYQDSLGRSLQPVSPRCVLVPGAVPPQVRDMAPPFVHLQEVSASLFLQPV